MHMPEMYRLHCKVLFFKCFFGWIVYEEPSFMYFYTNVALGRLVVECTVAFSSRSEITVLIF